MNRVSNDNYPVQIAGEDMYGRITVYDNRPGKSPILSFPSFRSARAFVEAVCAAHFHQLIKTQPEKENHGSNS